MVQQLQAALLYMGSTGTASSWLLKEKAYLIKPGSDVACCLAICHYSVTSYTMVQATSETNRTKKYTNWINTSNRNTQIHKLVHTNTVCIKCVWNIPMFNNLFIYIHACLATLLKQVLWKSVPDWEKTKQKQKNNYTKWNTQQNPNSSLPQTTQFSVWNGEWRGAGEMLEKSPLSHKNTTHDSWRWVNPSPVTQTSRWFHQCQGARSQVNCSVPAPGTWVCSHLVLYLCPCIWLSSGNPGGAPYLLFHFTASLTLGILTHDTLKLWATTENIAQLLLKVLHI